MRRFLLWVLAANLVQAQEIRKAVEPRKFVEAVGWRSALLGREDGTFEAWTMPVQVLRDFRLLVYFDGALEPVPLSDLAERVSVSPGHVTITHAHAAFTIRQTWVAAQGQPAAVVLLDIDTARPLRLRAAFTIEMSPMWPASFGGQSSSFQPAEHALVIEEGLRRYAAVVGSPLFTRSSEQIGHQLPDRTTLLEMDVTPDMARHGTIPIVIAGSGSGAADAIKLYRATVAEAAGLVGRTDRYYQVFQTGTMKLETPDPVINHAFEWAKYAVEKGWQCDDGVGCGLVAGFGQAGPSQRPGFAWFFGGDALMNSWSIADYGDFGRARGTLEFLRDHQRSDGKIMHELTQSAAVVDWSKYSYGYYHAETTPLYLLSAARFVARSGDKEFLERSWPSLEKAYQFCVSMLDTDGLMSNTKAGAAATETGALAGRVDKDIYLAGAWLAGLDGYARLASWSSHAEAAAAARGRLEKARASLNGWFRDAKGFYPFAKLADGKVYEGLSGWQALALSYGGLNDKNVSRATAALNRPELSTDWGVRLFATDSPSYDPLSYNDGSVWPFVTSFVTMAEYQRHRPLAAMQHLYGIAALTGSSGPGLIPEYMSGSRAQPLAHAVPHQLFSSGAVIHPVVSGLLGLESDAIAGTVRFAPHLPSDWASVHFERYMVGTSAVSAEITRQKGLLRIKLSVKGKPLKVQFAPAFPPGTTLVNATINGRRAVVKLEPSESDVHVLFDTEPLQGAELTLRVRDGVEIQPPRPAIEPGDSPRGVRVVDTKVDGDKVTFELAGPAGTTAEVKSWRGDNWAADGGDGPVRFPPGDGFTRASMVFRRSGRPSTRAVKPAEEP
jgi:hypothetical protein